ncbi:lipoprotein signal peptidase LspA [soil metagenome]
MNSAFGRALGLIVVSVVVADWLSKFWIATRMALGESVVLIDGWLYLSHRKNPGVAFSMFADLPEVWRTPVLSALSMAGVILFFHIVASTTDLAARLAAAMVLAGAVGNLGDRILNGHVTDFVLMRHFPFVFNIADAAITLGGLLLASRMIFADVDALPARSAEAA